MIKRVCKKEISVHFVLYFFILKYLVKNRESTFTFCLYWLNIVFFLKEKEFQQINWNLELKDKDDKKLSWKSAYCDGVSLVLDGYRYVYGLGDYNPVQIRFTTVDHVKNGLNWYSYVNNDPVNFIDPFGLTPSDTDDSSKLSFSFGVTIKGFSQSWSIPGFERQVAIDPGTIVGFGVQMQIDGENSNFSIDGGLGKYSGIGITGRYENGELIGTGMEENREKKTGTEQ